jgi:glutamate-5-semialdehyde dehydrogenase
VILRGGKEASHSSLAIVNILRRVAAELEIPQDAIQLVATADRDAVGHFLRLAEFIDVAIPRGGEGLIRRVAEEAAMPVIKHFAGNCHVYVDGAADLKMAAEIVVNSKCQRMGVCNACESLLVHSAVASTFLPYVAELLHKVGVEVRGDTATLANVPGAVPATQDDYRTEYLGPIISVKVVESLEEAVLHINEYGSGHTDAIVTQSLDAARAFAAGVDSAAVMVNASTRFSRRWRIWSRRRNRY